MIDIKIGALKRNKADDGVGRCRVYISPQLGHLQDAGRGPRCPKRWEESPSEPVGLGVTEGRGEVEAGQDWHP